VNSSSGPCVECGVERTADTFYASVSSSYCRKCRYQKYKHNKKKPEYIKQASLRGKRYRQQNWAKMLAAYARKRQPESTLREEDLLHEFSEQNGLCFWFGVELDPYAESRDLFKPSLDRLDVDGPYDSENVVLSCLAANLGRQRASIERWQDFISKVQNDGQKESG